MMTTGISHAPHVIPSTVTAVGTFSTPSGPTTVYVARTVKANSFGVAYVQGRQISDFIMVGANIVRAGGLRMENLYLDPQYGQVWQIWGTAPPNINSVELRYPNGETSRVPLRHGIYLTLIAANCHGPSELITRIRSEELSQRFTTLGSTAAVRNPEAQGSPLPRPTGDNDA